MSQKKQRPSKVKEAPAVEKLRRWEKRVIVFCCLASAVRVFIFSGRRWRDIVGPVSATLFAALVPVIACLERNYVLLGDLSFYPSQKEPYFTSGRLIAGVMIPFVVLYVDGIAFLLNRFSRVVGPLVFVALAVVTMTASEFLLTAAIFESPYNWFHLP